MLATSCSRYSYNGVSVLALRSVRDRANNLDSVRLERIGLPILADRPLDDEIDALRKSGILLLFPVMYTGE